MADRLSAPDAATPVDTPLPRSRWLPDARWVYAALVLFAVGLALWPPRVLLIIDEERYVTQAMAFARGDRALESGAVTLETGAVVASDTPPLTSILQTPFVRLAGWRGAAILSLLSLGAATLATMAALRLRGMPPAFALIVPGFLGAAFFGRIAMSDVPAAAMVALSLWLFLSLDVGGRERWRAFTAGFTAALAVAMREPTLLLVAPVAIGALLRRTGSAWAIVAGGAAGIALRLLLAALVFDAPFYMRDPGYGFSLASLGHTLPVYAIVLGAMLPAGALLPFFYRGPRRPELLVAAGLYVALFLTYEYDSVRENGPVKGLLLASRFMVPALPLFALMAGDVVPRLATALVARTPALSGVMRFAALTAGIGAIAVAVAVHPLADAESREPRAIVADILASTDDSTLVLSNTKATLKYLSPAYGRRRIVERQHVTTDSAAALARAEPRGMTLVFLDRSDSEMFRADADSNAMFVAALRARCLLGITREQRYGSWARLSVLHVSGCR